MKLETFKLGTQPLSSAAYQPECLHLMTLFQQETSKDWPGLLIQFNHFNTWLLFPEFEEHCLAHMATTDLRNNYFKFATGSPLKTRPVPYQPLRAARETDGLRSIGKANANK